MNRPLKIHSKEWDDTRTYGERAWRIVDRVLPKLPPAHGFYDPAGFVARGQRNYAREELYWRTMPRLRAKAEGGRPFIAMPKHCDHIYGGSIMERISRELELAA